MAENVQETRPPEPPSEVPLQARKPTERTGVTTPGRPDESQQSAQQDAHSAAQSEFAKATTARELDSLRPTPTSQARLNADAEAKDGLATSGLRPTPEFQAKLDEFKTEKPQRSATATPQEGGAGQRRGQDTQTTRPSDAGLGQQRAQDAQSAGARDLNAAVPLDVDARPQRVPDARAADVPDRNGASAVGEQTRAYAATRQAVDGERAKAVQAANVPGDAVKAQPVRGPGSPQDSRAFDRELMRDPARPAPVREASGTPSPVDQNTQRSETAVKQTTDQERTLTPTGTYTTSPREDGYTGPEHRQYTARHLDPSGDLRRDPQTTTEDDHAQPMVSRVSSETDHQEQAKPSPEPDGDVRDFHNTTAALDAETDGDPADVHRLNENRDEGDRPLQTGGELRRVRNSLDFDTAWADDAYGNIRANDDDIPAIARTAESRGFSSEDIKMIKDHVFRNEHLLDSYDAGTMARFDANPRMAEAWERLANGNPHPADFDLLSHERFEANYMASTGDPSYRRAHAAAIEAGHTWDSEAAADDGFGYQQRWP